MPAAGGLKETLKPPRAAPNLDQLTAHSPFHDAQNRTSADKVINGNCL